ncbi:MAG TPA: hypothetical protein VFX84_00955 [Candidatus Saccharimonadales bacterium]|nr:hypothetical protein [Candidatus Saccharimonadales bacterium]
MEFAASLPENRPEPGPEAPDLKLIRGGGEGGEPEGPPRPDLYAVPDPADPETPTPAADTAEDAAAGEARAERPSARHLRAAEQTVRVARLHGSAASESHEGRRRYKKSGGGSWLIRQHMKKLAEEKAKAEAASHDAGCSCRVCDSW